MVSDFPGVLESMENGKETAPEKNILKNINIWRHIRKNMKMEVSILAPQRVENSLLSGLEAFWLLFGPQVVSRRHLGVKVTRKWTLRTTK